MIDFAKNYLAALRATPPAPNEIPADMKNVDANNYAAVMAYVDGVVQLNRVDDVNQIDLSGV